MTDLWESRFALIVTKQNKSTQRVLHEFQLCLTPNEHGGRRAGTAKERRRVWRFEGMGQEQPPVLFTRSLLAVCLCVGSLCV